MPCILFVWMFFGKEKQKPFCQPCRAMPCQPASLTTGVPPLPPTFFHVCFRNARWCLFFSSGRHGTSHQSPIIRIAFYIYTSNLFERRFLILAKNPLEAVINLGRASPSFFAIYAKLSLRWVDARTTTEHRQGGMHALSFMHVRCYAIYTRAAFRGAGATDNKRGRYIACPPTFPAKKNQRKCYVYVLYIYCLVIATHSFNW